MDRNESISKGILHRIGLGHEEHWTWADTVRPPDMDNYARDGKYISGKILSEIHKNIETGNHQEALKNLKIALQTYPYSEELIDLMGNWFSSEKDKDKNV